MLTGFQSMSRINSFQTECPVSRTSNGVSPDEYRVLRCPAYVRTLRRLLESVREGSENWVRPHLLSGACNTWGRTLLANSIEHRWHGEDGFSRIFLSVPIRLISVIRVPWFFFCESKADEMHAILGQIRRAAHQWLPPPPTKKCAHMIL